MNKRLTLDEWIVENKYNYKTDVPNYIVILILFNALSMFVTVHYLLNEIILNEAFTKTAAVFAIILLILSLILRTLMLKEDFEEIEIDYELRNEVMFKYELYLNELVFEEANKKKIEEYNKK